MNYISRTFLFFEAKINKEIHYLAWLRDNTGNVYDLGTSISSDQMRLLCIDPVQFISENKPTVAATLELDVNGKLVPVFASVAYAKVEAKINAKLNSSDVRELLDSGLISPTQAVEVVSANIYATRHTTHVNLQQIAEMKSKALLSCLKDSSTNALSSLGSFNVHKALQPNEQTVDVKAKTVDVKATKK